MKSIAAVILATLLACLTATAASAQTTSGTINLSWSAVVTNTNGTAVTNPIVYNVLDCVETTQGTPCTPVALAGAAFNGISALSASITGLTPGTTHCNAVVAIEQDPAPVGNTPGAPSNVICSAIPVPTTPNATVITVTVTILNP